MVQILDIIVWIVGAIFTPAKDGLLQSGCKLGSGWGRGFSPCNHTLRCVGDVSVDGLDGICLVAHALLLAVVLIDLDVCNDGHALIGVQISVVQDLLPVEDPVLIQHEILHEDFSLDL